MDTLPPLLTVGHSTRPLADLLALLARHGVRSVADVRAFPASRANPQYRRESLAPALAAAGVRYEWIPALGGRRPRPRGAPRFGGWTEPGFQGYEAHMSTDEFADGLDRLLALARETAPDRTAFMCSESKWWGCHRSMIADALAARGFAVWHIMGRTAASRRRRGRGEAAPRAERRLAPRGGRAAAAVDSAEAGGEPLDDLMAHPLDTRRGRYAPGTLPPPGRR